MNFEISIKLSSQIVKDFSNWFGTGRDVIYRRYLCFGTQIDYLHSDIIQPIKYSEIKVNILEMAK